MGVRTTSTSTSDCRTSISHVNGFFFFFFLSLSQNLFSLQHGNWEPSGATVLLSVILHCTPVKMCPVIIRRLCLVQMKNEAMAGIKKSFVYR